MGFLRFIFSKLFGINLAFAGVIAVGVAASLFFWMEAYTEHGISVEVPDFSGIPINDIAAFADTLEVEFMIIDSLYSDEFPRGTVADQEPKAGYSVKRGRKVYLIVNAVLPKQVVLPDVRDLSLRQAKSILETVGLQLGVLEYVPDIAKNAVLHQKVNGISVTKGETFFHGTVVDLVLGDGLSNTKVCIPYLIYYHLDEAVERIRFASLNLATFKMDSTVTDTGSARVYKQVPAYNDKNLLAMGSSIILYLTADTISIEYDSIYFTAPVSGIGSLIIEDDFYGDFEKDE